jgi:molybdopterin molybdotransferase
MAAAPENPKILSFEEARKVVEEHAALLGSHREVSKRLEEVDLLHAPGRVLGEPITADRDFPPFPRATRDGYAIRAADLKQLPATLDVIAEIKAGVAREEIPIELRSGQAAAIMTGAPAPPGADAIVMVEYTSRHQERVEIKKGVAAGDNIVPVGAEARRGDLLIGPGVRLDQAAIAVAASVGKSELLVHVRPRVAVLATGDEVVDISVQPGPNQIRNSNSYSLAAQIQAAGGGPILLPIAPDEPKRLRELIERGLDAHLLLLAGGVSMGKYDLVEQVLSELKAEFFFTGAQIQPGRPVVFGRIRDLKGHGSSPGAERSVGTWPSGPEGKDEVKYFFGLPGNPVSAMVTFELFARPVIEALAGMSPGNLVFLHARLKSEIKTKTGLKRFLPAVLSGEFESTEVELAPWQGSGDIAATARANCYVVIPPDRDRIPAGEWVPVLLR